MYSTQRIDFNKARSVGEIFSCFWDFLTSEWRSYGLMLLFFVSPFSFAAAYFVVKWNYNVETIISGDLTDKSLVLIGLSFFAKLFGQLVSCGYVHIYVSGGKIDFDAMKNYVLENFIQAFLATVVFMLLLTVGFLCFFIPGIILLPALSMLMYDVLFARQGYIAGVSRCFNLCRTNWKQSFAVVLLCYVAVILFSSFFDVVIDDKFMLLYCLIVALASLVEEIIMIPFILLYYSLANQNLNL